MFMKASLKELLSQCSASDYYEIIESQHDNRVEAVYYLLRDRLFQALKIVYESHGFALVEEYDDSIDDFFLYLYDDNAKSDEAPFSIFRGIKNKNAFFAWILSTYRRYLLNRVKEAQREQMSYANVIMFSKEEEGLLSEEKMCTFLANAIAYADQQLAPMKRFVLYRMLLSFLDHRKAIPQEEMAKAMHLNAITYRVYTKRQKDRFLKYIDLQEKGGQLELDTKHQTMRDELLSGLEHLYSTLGRYYKLTLEELPNADEIACLRKKFSDGEAENMHEAQAGYGYKSITDIRMLYEKLKDYLYR